jgi:hypothetical protein
MHYSTQHSVSATTHISRKPCEAGEVDTPVYRDLQLYPALHGPSAALLSPVDWALAFSCQDVRVYKSEVAPAVFVVPLLISCRFSALPVLFTSHRFDD